MVLNYIWIAFFVIAFVVAVCKLLFFGDTQIFTEIINSTFDSSKTASEISRPDRCAVALARCNEDWREQRPD